MTVILCYCTSGFRTVPDPQETASASTVEELLQHMLPREIECMELCSSWQAGGRVGCAVLSANVTALCFLTLTCIGRELRLQRRTMNECAEPFIWEHSAPDSCLTNITITSGHHLSLVSDTQHMLNKRMLTEGIVNREQLSPAFTNMFDYHQCIFWQGSDK